MMNRNSIIERTAPSPTGHLHLGHVFSALTAFQHSQKFSGLFKLRIEDIDYSRCKKEYERQIIDDLIWLGFKWNGQILKQNNRKKYYTLALNELSRQGLIYPCSCTRSDIHNATSAPHKIQNKKSFYPGTCLQKPPNGGIVALRLNIKKAFQTIERSQFHFYESGMSTRNLPEKKVIDKDKLINTFGDFVIARKDIGTSYNLSAVIDDSEQQITHVTRGRDLLDITPIQILLQKLLGIKSPFYHHHQLLCDAFGKRLAKRTNSLSVYTLRKNGSSPADVIEMALNHTKI